MFFVSCWYRFKASSASEMSDRVDGTSRRLSRKTYRVRSPSSMWRQADSVSPTWPNVPVSIGYRGTHLEQSQNFAKAELSITAKVIDRFPFNVIESKIRKTILKRPAFQKPGYERMVQSREYLRSRRKRPAKSCASIRARMTLIAARCFSG